ncbi:hypothetical protein E2C01_061222 [Portunus trituberculatus]|uniref:Uncharacterized protein n=1 Tax=Portunus trituberculatus TaxID=210409 RepID=A0A5B7HDT1_PORTR|nr:hypothetical protein [Portunus trituberculatus]
MATVVATIEGKVTAACERQVLFLPNCAWLLISLCCYSAKLEFPSRDRHLQERHGLYYHHHHHHHHPGTGGGGDKKRKQLTSTKTLPGNRNGGNLDLCYYDVRRWIDKKKRT